MKLRAGEILNMKATLKMSSTQSVHEREDNI